MCVMTGNTLPYTHKIQVSYKQLIQHWFTKCSELTAENDRLLAIDSIPPSIRRANPNLTRDFYLKHRSQV